MGLTTASSLILHNTMPPAVAAHLPAARRRRITQQAGRALEILGHAIEYLADEYACHGSQMQSGKSHLEAMRLLMERNRQIYFECPEIPTFGERCMAMLNRLWN